MFLVDLFKGLEPSGKLTLFDAKAIVRNITEDFKSYKLLELEKEIRKYLESNLNAHQFQDVLYFEIINEGFNFDDETLGESIYYLNSYKHHIYLDTLTSLKIYPENTKKKIIRFYTNFVEVEYDYYFRFKDVIKLHNYIEFKILEISGELDLFDRIGTEAEIINKPDLNEKNEINPFSNDVSKELFNTIIKNWNYDRNQRFADIFNEMNSANYIIPYKNDYELYIKNRFDYKGRFQYDKIKSETNRDKKDLLEIIKNFRRK